MKTNRIPINQGMEAYPDTRVNRSALKSSPSAGLKDVNDNLTSQIDHIIQLLAEQDKKLYEIYNGLKKIKEFEVDEDGLPIDADDREYDVLSIHGRLKSIITVLYTANNKADFMISHLSRIL